MSNYKLLLSQWKRFFRIWEYPFINNIINYKLQIIISIIKNHNILFFMEVNIRTLSKA